MIFRRLRERLKNGYFRKTSRRLPDYKKCINIPYESPRTIQFQHEITSKDEEKTREKKRAPQKKLRNEKKLDKNNSQFSQIFRHKNVPEFHQSTKYCQLFT